MIIYGFIIFFFSRRIFIYSFSSAYNILHTAVSGPLIVGARRASVTKSKLHIRGDLHNVNKILNSNYKTRTHARTHHTEILRSCIIITTSVSSLFFPIPLRLLLCLSLHRNTVRIRMLHGWYSNK